MTTSATLLAGEAGQCICVSMGLAPLMDNVKVEFLEPLQPPCQLPLRVLEVSQPG